MRHSIPAEEDYSIALPTQMASTQLLGMDRLLVKLFYRVVSWANYNPRATSGAPTISDRSASIPNNGCSVAGRGRRRGDASPTTKIQW